MAELIGEKRGGRVGGVEAEGAVSEGENQRRLSQRSRCGKVRVGVVEARGQSQRGQSPRDRCGGGRVTGVNGEGVVVVLGVNWYSKGFCWPDTS